MSKVKTLRKSEKHAQSKSKNRISRLEVKTQPKKKESKISRLASKRFPTKTKHRTDRYASSGHPLGAPSTRITEKRREVEDFVEQGGATIGSVLENFKKGGLVRVARLVRYGHYGIKGISAQSKEDRKTKTSQELANKLAKMPPTTRISVLVTPIRLVD